MTHTPINLVQTGTFIPLSDIFSENMFSPTNAVCAQVQRLFFNNCRLLLHIIFVFCLLFHTLTRPVVFKVSFEISGPFIVCYAVLVLLIVEDRMDFGFSGRFLALNSFPCLCIQYRY